MSGLDASRPVVLTFVRAYLPGYKSGGPVRTIANMAAALGDEVDFRIVTSDRDAMDTERYPHLAADEGWRDVGKARVLYLSPARKGLRNIGRIIRETPHDTLYLNSVFDPVFSLKPLLARRLGLAPPTRCVIAPRGEFSEGALGLKATRKRAFLAASRALGLHRNLIWQASSAYEADDIGRAMRRDAADVRIAADLPAPMGSEAVPAHRPRAEDEPLRIVFLSRISPQKNLDFALEVLKQVRVPVTFDIYGEPDDRSYWARCRALMSDMPGHVCVCCHGGIDHDDVPATLARYDLFFLPTRGESYGHAIVESLAAGTPVLISDATPWRNLAGRGIGWDLPLENPAVFAACLERAFACEAAKWARARYLAMSFFREQQTNGEAVANNRSLFGATRERLVIGAGN